MNCARLYLIVASIIFIGCIDSDKGKMMSDELYELPQDCNFSKVVNNSGLNYDCTPKLRGSPKKFQGLLINGPKEVVWPNNYDLTGMAKTRDGDVIASPIKLMIAGLTRLPSNTLNLNGVFNDRVLIIAVNQKTGEVYSGRMQVSGSRPDPLPPIFSDSSSVGSFKEDAANNTSIVGDRFNIDLIHNLGIPIENGTYTVYATLGDYKSNVLTIKTRVE